MGVDPVITERGLHKRSWQGLVALINNRVKSPILGFWDMFPTTNIVILDAIHIRHKRASSETGVTIFLKTIMNILRCHFRLWEIEMSIFIIF